jgi:hypothetical protein
MDKGAASTHLILACRTRRSFVRSQAVTGLVDLADRLGARLNMDHVVKYLRTLKETSYVFNRMNEMEWLWVLKQAGSWAQHISLESSPLPLGSMHY